MIQEVYKEEDQELEKEDPWLKKRIMDQEVN